MRLCDLGATHRLKVHGGHDDANPHRLFMVYEVVSASSILSFPY